MKSTAEFKIDLLSLAGWDDTPVICKREFRGENENILRLSAELHASKLVGLTDREVRWNWVGSKQGNYIRPAGTPHLE